jgi:hypothetical protein
MRGLSRVRLGADGLAQSTQTLNGWRVTLRPSQHIYALGLQ